MVSLNPHIKRRVLLICIGFLLFFFVFKTVIFFTAKPKVKVNYVAEYNRITRPADYDPNENAAPYCEKAFGAFVQMPNDLKKPYKYWPTDFNSVEQSTLEDWLLSNGESFEYFQIAAKKPYFWLERQAKEDNWVNSILTPDLYPLYLLTEAILWNVKLNACNGRIESAFKDVDALDCSGHQKCRPESFIMEQYLGMRIKNSASFVAIEILEKAQIDSETLKVFQEKLQRRFDSDRYVPGFEAEKLLLYDVVQRIFIDNGRGTGRLAWSVGWYLDTTKGFWGNIIPRYRNCLFGPTRKETEQRIEQISVMSNQLMGQTPWEIENQQENPFEKMQAIYKSNFLLELLGIDLKGIFERYHKTRTQTKALIAIIAILRFKNDTNHFPGMLEELVDTGYLKSVPMDPFSNGSLVYKVTGDNFTLYSVGSDFSDDGGESKDVVSFVQIPFRLGGLPTEKPDIVYWPVRKRRKPTPEELRQMREAMMKPLVTGFERSAPNN